MPKEAFDMLHCHGCRNDRIDVGPFWQVKNLAAKVQDDVPEIETLLA